jgi:hypothetical protein
MGIFYNLGKSKIYQGGQYNAMATNKPRGTAYTAKAADGNSGKVTSPRVASSALGRKEIRGY